MPSIYKKNCLAFLGVLLLCGCDFIDSSIRDTYKENNGDSLILMEGGDRQKERQIPEHPTFSNLSIADIKNLMQEGKWDGTLNLFSRSDWWNSAQHSLEEIELFKEKSLLFYKTIHFYSDGRISVKIQNPDCEDEIDSYWYIKGEWKKKTPVKLNAGTEVQASLSALSSVSFSNVADIYNLVTSDREVTSENRILNHIYLTQDNKKDNELMWRGSLSTERKLLNFRADVSPDKTIVIQY